MFSINEKDNLIEFKISSDMKLVDRLILSTKEYLEQFNISDFSEFRLVLRELLINAVEHGNKNNFQKTVSCDIEHLGNFRFKLTIQDQGKGFDLKEININMPDDPRQIRSRGYALINSYSDRVEFNETGNRVIVHISMPVETRFALTQEKGWQNIVPTGDITAGIADEFRKLLVKLDDKGHRKYLFDLKHVEDIDSVGLSILIIFAKMLDKQENEKKLVIVNARKTMMELFKMTRIDRIYEIKVNNDP